VIISIIIIKYIYMAQDREKATNALKFQLNAQLHVTLINIFPFLQTVAISLLSI